MKLKDRVAIVTGGGQGIGKGIVSCLAGEGADIAILTKSGTSGDAVAEEIKGMGRRALSIKADVTDKEQVEEAVRKTMDTFGKIDILVNTVGGGSVDIAPFLKHEFHSAKSMQTDNGRTAEVYNALIRLTRNIAPFL